MTRSSDVVGISVCGSCALIPGLAEREKMRVEKEAKPCVQMH